MLQTTSQEQDDFRALDALILGQLRDEERAKSVVYLDVQLRLPGASCIAGDDHQPDAPYLVAFIDQRPGANWMHPCRYLLIDPVSGNITSIVSDHPPLFGPLPPTWRVVWRSLGIDDWRLLPVTGPSTQKIQKEKNP